MNEETILRQWEALTISNDFVFCKVMEDEALLAELINLILPDLEFTDLTIIPQKTEKDGLDTHGVRFDLFVKDLTGRVIEIEMQVLNTGNLPLRIRFYASMVDTQMLAPNESYSKLKESYIIMICPFDPYGQGRHIYSFRNRCDQDHGLLMGDDTVKIVLNAVGTIDDVSEGLKAFLDYVAGKPSEDEYIQKLEEAVKRTKANKTWRKLYMTQRMRDLENQDIGRAQGADMAKRDTIRNMLNKGMKAEEIADLCGYDISFVKEVEQDVMEPA